MESTDDSNVAPESKSDAAALISIPSSKWYDLGIVTLTALAALLSGIALVSMYLGVTSVLQLGILGAFLLFAIATIYSLWRARNARQTAALERWMQNDETERARLSQALEQSEQLRAQQSAQRSELAAKLAQLEQTQPSTRFPLIFGWQALGPSETEIAPQLAILAELFHDQEQIQIQKKFRGGHRNRGVYQVRSSGEVDRIVKIARSADIRAEQRAQKIINRFSQNNGGQYVRDTQRADDDAYGGIVYQLASLRRNANLMNLDAFYRQTSERAACVAVIEQVYAEALPHSTFRWREDAPLFREHALPERALRKIVAMVQENVTLQDGALESENVRVLFGSDAVAIPNPLFWAEQILPRYAAENLPASLGVIHGDLHSGNLLIEQPSLNLWLIDFAKTRDRAHTLTDFARLEADLKFYLLTSNEENYFAHALAFEQALLAPNAARELELAFQTFETYSAEFQKAAACILALRRVAVQHRREEQDASVGHFATASVVPYYLALWQATLHTLKYEQCNRAQKTFAFISAGMLCERITQLVT